MALITMALRRKFASSRRGHNRCAMASVRKVVVNPNNADLNPDNRITNRAAMANAPIRPVQWAERLVRLVPQAKDGQHQDQQPRQSKPS